MNLPDGLLDFLRQEGWGAVRSARPLGGGCINNAARLETERGPVALLKRNPAAPEAMFASEADGLRALAAAPGAPRVPAVYACGADWLLLEYLAPAPRRPDFWETLGQGLAALHQSVHDRFGFAADNYLGLTPQPNPWTADGWEFFAHSRLGFQGDRAAGRGLLTSTERAQLGRLIRRLPDLVPAQPASLLHGDLWGGNLLCGPDGRAALIDPAAHFGWAEADLAMTALFGGFDRRMVAAYEQVRPLTPGWRERFDLYNLYHLLNHLNLFGAGYHGQVAAILRRYS